MYHNQISNMNIIVIARTEAKEKKIRKGRKYKRKQKKSPKQSNKDEKQKQIKHAVGYARRQNIR